VYDVVLDDIVGFVLGSSYLILIVDEFDYEAREEVEAILWAKREVVGVLTVWAQTDNGG
jgi:hypothetical protein